MLLLRLLAEVPKHGGAKAMGDRFGSRPNRGLFMYCHCLTESFLGKASGAETIHVSGVIQLKGELGDD